MSQNFWQIPKHEVIANVHNAVNKWVERRESEAKIAEKILIMYQQADVTQSPTENPINLMILGNYFERKALQAFLYDYDYTDTVEKKQEKQTFLANLLAEEIKFHQQIIVDCNTIVRRWRYFDLKSDAVLNQVQYLILHDSENAYRVYEENVLLTWNIPDENLPKLEIRESPRDCEIKSFSKIIEELDREECENASALAVEKLRQEEMKEQANDSCESERTDGASSSQLQSTNFKNSQIPTELPPAGSHQVVPTSAEKMASNQNDSAGYVTVGAPKTKKQERNEKKAVKARRIHQCASSFVRNEKNATLSVQISAEPNFNKNEESASLLAHTPIMTNTKPVSKNNEPLSNLPETSQAALEACTQSSIPRKIGKAELGEQNKVQLEQKIVEKRKPKQLSNTLVVSSAHTSSNEQKNAWPGASQPTLKVVATASSSVSTNTVPPPLTKTQKKNAKKAAKFLREASLTAQNDAEKSVVGISPERKAVEKKTSELLATISAEIETQKDAKSEAVPLEQEKLREKENSVLLTTTAAENEKNQTGLDVAVQPSIAEKVEETDLNKNSDTKDKVVVDSLEQLSEEERKQLATTSVVSHSRTSDNRQKIAWPGAIQPAFKVSTTASSSVSAETRPMTKTDKKKTKAAARLLREAALNAQKNAKESVVATLPEKNAPVEIKIEPLTITSAANETKNDGKDEVVADPLEQREVEKVKEPNTLLAEITIETNEEPILEGSKMSTTIPAGNEPFFDSNEQKALLPVAAETKLKTTGATFTEALSRGLMSPISRGDSPDDILPKAIQSEINVTIQSSIPGKDKETEWNVLSADPENMTPLHLSKTQKKKAKKAAKLLSETKISSEVVEDSIVVETDLKKEDGKGEEGFDTDTSLEAVNDNEPLKKDAQPTQRRVVSGRKKAKKNRKNAKNKHKAASNSQEATSSSQEATSSDQAVPKISKYQKKRAKIAAKKQELLGVIEDILSVLPVSRTT